jgi:hypothetical protein
MRAPDAIEKCEKPQRRHPGIGTQHPEPGSELKAGPAEC